MKVYGLFIKYETRDNCDFSAASRTVFESLDDALSKFNEWSLEKFIHEYCMDFPDIRHCMNGAEERNITNIDEDGNTLPARRYVSKMGNCEICVVEFDVVTK